MANRYQAELIAYARLQGLSVNPAIVVEENACYAPLMIGPELRVGDMWLLSKWGWK